MLKTPYVVMAAAFFIGGAYFWQARHAGLAQIALPALPAPQTERAPASLTMGASPAIVEIGKERVSEADVEWEYQLLLHELDDQKSLTPIPDLGKRAEEELLPLKKSLVSALIERKLLFAYIQQDRSFSFEDPARYVDCLGEWQKSVASGQPESQGPGAEARLKARLCERSILSQYIKERLFAGVTVADADFVEYYKNHMSEFKVPERAEIRHLLLGTEGEARKWQSQATPQNFEGLARAHSLAPEAKQGGRLGPFAKGTMPTVLETAFTMKKGEISPVLRSNYGYHVIMVLDLRPAKTLSLEEARPEIARILRKKREDEAYHAWVERALATINVGTPKAVW